MRAPFRLVVLAFFALATPLSLSAGEIQGKVIAARGKVVRIRLKGELAPKVGDSLELFEAQHPGFSEDAPVRIGRGSVMSVEDDIAVARIIDEGTSEPPARGQTVTIQSEKSDKLAAEARRHDPRSGTAPTEEQARPLMDAICTGLSKGDSAALEDAIDLDAVQARMIGSTKLSDPMQEVLSWMIDSVATSLPALLKFGTNDSPPACRLLRFRTVTGEARPLFRLLTGTGEVLYLELLMLRSESGVLRVADVRRIENCAWLSELLRHWMVPDGNSLAKLNQLRMPSAADLDICTKDSPFRTLIELSGQHEHEGVVSWFDDHEDVLGKSPLAHSLRVAATSYSHPDACPDVVAEAGKAFPEDLSVAFACALALLRLGKSDLAIAAFDRLDLLLGGDAFINVLRARLHVAVGRDEDARKCATRATEAEPTLTPAWQTRMEIELRKKDYSEAVSLLKSMNGHGLKLGDLGELENLGDFKASDHYRNWLKDNPTER